MKVIKKAFIDVPTEQAHGGSGSRKLFIGDEQSPSKRIQGLTHGWLPAGSTFAMHDHDGIEEIMYVMDGTGTVRDNDGEYDYTKGDVFIFPTNTMHEIINPTNQINQFIFMRLYVW